MHFVIKGSDLVASVAMVRKLSRPTIKHLYLEAFIF